MGAGVDGGIGAKLGANRVGAGVDGRLLGIDEVPVPLPLDGDTVGDWTGSVIGDNRARAEVVVIPGSDDGDGRA